MSVGSDFELRRATADDEADLRALVGLVAMPGAVAVRFAREPDYFLGTTIMGEPCDVLAVRHRESGTLAGMACRAEHRAYVGGDEARVGYLGQIRVAPEFQGRWLVLAGARWYRERTPAGMLDIGVVAGDNPRARELLVGRRTPGGIRAVRVAGLTTFAILLRPRRRPRSPGIVVERSSHETLPEVVEFLREHGPRRQFFPAYTLEDFTGGATLRGLEPADVMIARKDGAVVGVMAAWDQSAYKQDIVESYGPTLARWRPVVDVLARLIRARPLTKPGHEIPLDFAACTCVAGDDPVVMRALLAACMERARERGKAFLMLGLADEDPLLQVAAGMLHVTYTSDLYALSWDDDPSSLLDGRTPYIEIATL